MCISFFGITAAQAYAANSASKLFTVKEGIVEDGKITFTVSLTTNVTGFGGAVLWAVYDGNVLEPSAESAPAYKTNGEQYFGGMYTYGKVSDAENIYAIGYANTKEETVKSVAPFFTLTFDVTDESRPSASVDFYCKEYYCADDDDLSIKPSDEMQSVASFKNVTTLEAPELVSATLFSGGISFAWEETEGANGYEIRRKSTESTWQVVAEVPADVLSYDDVYGLVSGETYTYSVKAENGYGKSVFDSAGVSCKYISKPTGITAVNVENGIQVSWDSKSSSGADQYTVLRRIQGETEWSPLIKRSASSTAVYKDTKVESGILYEYDVVSSLGGFTTEPAESGVRIRYIEIPSLISGSNSEDGIELLWKSSQGADYYVIYRQEIGKDSAPDIYDTCVLSYYTDTAVQTGKAYKYSIVAVDDSSNSAFTAGTQITRIKHTEITKLTQSTDGIFVFWSGLSGVDGYAVYRKTADSDWVKVGTQDKSAVSFKDTSVESGDEYYYAVVPYIGKSESAIVPFNTPVYYLKAPSNVTVTNTLDALRISWSVSKGAQEYQIWRKNGEKSDFSLLAVVGDAKQTEYIDKDVVDGEIYMYSVQALNPKGESKLSDYTPAVMRIACVSGIKTSFCNKGVGISWSKHAKADKYIVCRNESGVWTDVAVTASLKYEDSTVKSGKTYAYTVKPVVGGYVGGYDEDAISYFKYIEAPSAVEAVNNKASTTVSWSAVSGADGYQLYKANVSSDGSVGKFSKIATRSAKQTSYEDTNVKAGKKYVYVVYAIDGNTKSVASDKLTNIFIEIPQITSLSNAYGGASIKWKSVVGASKYRVYRKFDGEKKWTKIAVLPSKTLSYVDGGAKSNVKVSYAVRAENGNSLSSYTAKSFTFLASPVAKVANIGSGIKISWGSVAGAKSYYVYKKTSSDGSWKKIGTATGTSYTDKDVSAGKSYVYTVRAYNGSKLSGYNTNGWSIKRLTAPKLSAVSNNTKGIKFTWGAVKGAKEYYVYRKTSKNGSWTKIGSTQSTSYTDKNVKSGSTYYYTAKAVSGKSVSSYNGTGLSGKFLSAPSISSISNTAKGVSLKWKSINGAQAYYVYRKEGSAKKWTKLAEITSTSYTDKNVKNNKTYTYMIKAVSGKTVSGYNSDGWKIKRLNAPKLVSAKSSKSGITVKWEAVSGASGYIVYRKIGSGNYEQIATVKNKSTVSYLDKTAKKNVTYTYTVKAYSGSSKSAAASGLKCTDKY